jgi:hypothetical protein
MAVCTRSVYDDAPSRADSTASGTTTTVFTVVSNAMDSTIFLYSFDDPTISWAYMSPRHVIASHCTRVVPGLVGQLWAARKVQSGDPIEPGCGSEGAPDRQPLRLATAVEGSEGVVYDDSVAYFFSQQERVVHLDGSRCQDMEVPAAGSSPVPSFFRLNVHVAADSMNTAGRREGRPRASLRLAFGHDPPTSRGVSRVVKGGEQATATVSVDLDNLLQPLTVIANYSADFACPACNWREGIEGEEAAAADAAARRASQNAHARLPLIPCSLCGGTGRATAAATYHRAAFSMESTCPACKGVGAVTASGAPRCQACSGERHVSEPERTFHALIPAGAPSRLKILADTTRYDFLTLNLNVTPKERGPPLAGEEGGEEADAALGPWMRECEGASDDGSVADSTEPASAVSAALSALPLPDAVGCNENDGDGAHLAANVTVTLRTAAIKGMHVRLGHSVPGASSDADWALRLPPPVYPGDEAVILGAGLPVYDRASIGGCLWKKTIPHPPPPLELTRRDVADFLKTDCPRRVEEWINVSEALAAACGRADVESPAGADVAVPLLRLRSRTFFCAPVAARRDIATLFPHGAVILRVRVELGASETLGLSSSAEGMPGSRMGLLTDEELTTLIRALANAKAPQATGTAPAPTTGESVE